MFRLSRKAWNNVLMFSMLIMIMVFNGLHNRFNASEDTLSAQPLIAADELILSLDFNQYVIERIGRTWRLVSKETTPALSDERVANVAIAWQQQHLEHAGNEASALINNGQTPAQIVTIWLAGHSDGQVFAFYQDAGRWFVRHQQSERLMIVSDELYSSFIPVTLSTSP